jgi:hypothetical protein
MGTLVELASPRSGFEYEPPIDAAADTDPLPFGLILWAASVARVACALVRHEEFGTEIGLAFACIILVPWLLLADRSRSAHGAQRSPAPTWTERPNTTCAPNRRTPRRTLRSQE